MQIFIELSFKFSMYGFLAGLVLAVSLFSYYSRDLPDYHTLGSYYPPAVTSLYSADAVLVEEYAKEYTLICMWGFQKCKWRQTVNNVFNQI